MNNYQSMPIEFGRISKYIEVPEIILRLVIKYGVAEEFDGEKSYGSDDSGDNEKEPEFRLQGRLVNISRYKLCSIKYDISYFDTNSNYLGFNISRIIDEYEMDIDDHMPIDLRADIPGNASKCAFNVRAKRAGMFFRLLWG